MAELFLARATTGRAGSIEKHVVLKRVLPERLSDPQFVKMFLDEARLAGQLNHQNIAQVFDIGRLGESYYFTMEYVHGEDVRAMLARQAALERKMPIDHVLHIATGVAAGLDYAYARTGADGQPLGIVHRDISPSNVMVSFEGAVKLVDFGVAKAKHRSVQTQVGAVKGKVAYLSPEQCRGRPVDRRSDVFSLGILMHEMLTNVRLFRRASDYETMQAVVHDEIDPPSRLRPQVTPNIDAVVVKALHKEPAERFPTAGHMLLAIEDAQRRDGFTHSPLGLGRYLREMFGERPEPWIELANRDDSPSVVTVASQAADLPELGDEDPHQFDDPEVEAQLKGTLVLRAPKLAAEAGGDDPEAEWGDGSDAVPGATTTVAPPPKSGEIVTSDEANDWSEVDGVPGGTTNVRAPPSVGRTRPSDGPSPMRAVRKRASSAYVIRRDPDEARARAASPHVARATGRAQAAQAAQADPDAAQTIDEPVTTAAMAAALAMIETSSSALPTRAAAPRPALLRSAPDVDDRELAEAAVTVARPRPDALRAPARGTASDVDDEAVPIVDDGEAVDDLELDDYAEDGVGPVDDLELDAVPPRRRVFAIVLGGLGAIGVVLLTIGLWAAVRDRPAPPVDPVAGPRRASPAATAADPAKPSGRRAAPAVPEPVYDPDPVDPVPGAAPPGAPEPRDKPGGDAPLDGGRKEPPRKGKSKRAMLETIRKASAAQQWSVALGECAKLSSAGMSTQGRTTCVLAACAAKRTKEARKYAARLKDSRRIAVRQSCLSRGISLEN